MPSGSRASPLSPGSCTVSQWWRPGQSRGGLTGTGSHKPLPQQVQVSRHLGSHPYFAHKLRRGSQLPAHIRCPGGRIRGGDAAPSTGGQCVAAPSRGGPLEGRGIREPPGGLERGLASDDGGSVRRCHRHPCGNRRRQGCVACVRIKSGRGTCIPRAHGDHRPHRRRRPGCREPHRHRSRDSCNTFQAARSLTNDIGLAPRSTAHVTGKERKDTSEKLSSGGFHFGPDLGF